jgi:hypothetical protein
MVLIEAEKGAYGLASSGSVYRPVAETGEDGNEPSISTRGEGHLD